MSYTDGEGAILTRIQAHASFSSTNTARNDWSLLNSGNAKYYAFVTSGADIVEPEFITLTVYVIPWVTRVEVWRRYTADEEESDIASDLHSKINAIIGQVQAQRQLGLTSVQNSEIVGISTPQPMRPPAGGDPTWLMQEIHIRWLEQSSAVTYV